jgi:hypothetical protein
MTSPACARIRHTVCRFGGVVADYLEAVTEQWIKPAPHANPAMLEMFRDRDRQPLRCMVPWAGEFAGKYLTHAVQIYRMSDDAALGSHIKWFVGQLVAEQDDDGYLGPWPEAHRLTGSAPTWTAPRKERRRRTGTTSSATGRSGPTISCPRSRAGSASRGTRGDTTTSCWECCCGTTRVATAGHCRALGESAISCAGGFCRPAGAWSIRAARR